MHAGDRIGSFRVVAPLGRGGMGAVFRAVDEATGREVALKVMVDAWPDLDARRRFEREGRALAAVNHPHVVRVFAAGFDADRPFLALELAPGGALDARVRDRGGRLPWREAARVGAQVARGLAALHAAGLVHRDLKPANVLIGDDGLAKITDLGLVHADAATGLTRGDLTRTGEVLGTIAFMAPEQVQGAREVDARADLYALGATLFALAAGAPPFAGQSGLALLKHVLEAPAPDLRSVTDCHPGLAALVVRLLAKAPAARPSSAEEVALELERLAASDDAGGPRRVRLGLALAATLGVLGLALAATLAPTPPAPPVAPPSSSLSPATPSTSRPRPRASSPDPGADRDLRRLEQEASPAARAGAARAWLKAWPDHPRRDHVEAIARRAEALAPRPLDAPAGSAACFRDDGALVTAASDRVELWDAASGERRAELARYPADPLQQPQTLIPVPGGDVLVVMKQTMRHLTPSGVVVAERDFGTWVYCVDVDAVGHFLAGLDRDAALGDLETLAPTRTLGGHRTGVYAAALSPDGRLAVTGTGSSVGAPGNGLAEDNAFRVWDLASGAPPRRVEVPMRVSALALRGDEVIVGVAGGLLLRFGLDGAPRGELLRASTADATRRPTAHQNRIVGLAVSPDGRRLWSVSAHLAVNRMERSELVAWDLTTGAERYRVPEHAAPFRSIALSPDAQWLVTSSVDGPVELWRAD